MSKISAPRGTQDLLPPESTRRQAFERRIHEIARRFGYGEIRTPIFEATELFVRGMGETTDVVEKEMYTFADKGGRSLTLRPELTAGVVRALLEHNLLATGPQRLYYVGPCFRHERPQAGRYRQFDQVGFECFGFSEPEADVELILVAAEFLRAYRIDDAVLNLNSLGCVECRSSYREALLAHFRPHAPSLSTDSQRRLERNPLRILDSKAPEDAALVASSPTFLDRLCEPCEQHFAGVRALLDETGIAYVINPRLVRGFDYYTRTVFEFISSSHALGAQSTVCAGGRYDGLVESLGGPPTPAIGFGLGIDRFLLTVAAASEAADAHPSGIAAIALGQTARRALVPVIAELRRAAEILVTIDYREAKLDAGLKRAVKSGVRAALIVGENELASRRWILRDLRTRSQEDIEVAADSATNAQAILAHYRAFERSGSAEVKR